MNIDWNAVTPWASSAGGALIGTAAGILILFNGRIAGISGILGGLLSPSRGDISWRVAFIAGLLAAPLVYGWFFLLPGIIVGAGNLSLIIAGLLVGFGVRYGSGCTSGHGICGLSRLSPRSLVATTAFTAAGFATVYLIRNLL